jgi:large subunit ribosomal protein L27
MAHRKAGGTAKNLRDSKPKYLGVKIADGQNAKPGAIIVRQRGTRILPGKNVRIGKDHTIFSTVTGTVKFSLKRGTRFDGRNTRKSIVHVVAQ